MMTNAKRQKMIAYHEAGHAVIARVLGVDVQYVTLLSTTPNSPASVMHESAAWLARDADTPTRLAALEKDAKVLLAGPLAEQTLAEQQPQYRSDDTQKSGTIDFKQAGSIVLRMVELRRGINPSTDDDIDDAAVTEVNDLLQRLNNEANDLVEKNWPAIERVAKALLARPILNQDDVDALIAGRRWPCFSYGRTITPLSPPKLRKQPPALRRTNEIVTRWPFSRL